MKTVGGFIMFVVVVLLATALAAMIISGGISFYESRFHYGNPQ